MALSDHIKKDTPTNNFATWNPLNGVNSLELGNGNLYLSNVTGGPTGYQNSTGQTIRFPKSKIWYCETLITGAASATYFVLCTKEPTNGVGWEKYAVFYNGSIYDASDTVVSTGHTVLAVNDILGVLVDEENKSANFYVNGTYQGNISLTGLSENLSILGGSGSSGSSINFYANFGQDPTFGGARTSALSNGSAAGDGGYTTDGTDETGGAFFYQPPAGAKALCTANLEDITPNVDDDVPGDYFKAKTYTGTGSNPNSIDIGFKPDLVWIKMRNNSAANSNASTSHVVSDSVRGIPNFLITNSSNDEYTTADGYTSTSNLTSYNSNGFSVGTELNFNGNGDSYVSWSWKAGGAPTGGFTGTEAMVDGVETTCSALASSAGASITPTGMSVNTKAGFSIIKYTGTGSAATVPHGLSAAPELIICKTLSQTIQWVVYHKDTGPDGFLGLNTTSAFSSDTDYWGTGTGVTNAVFGLQNAAGGNNHTSDLIAYCWHSVAGYSAFGSYEGNASTDGPFVYTGFKPAWVMIKNIDTTSSALSSWGMYDNARNPYNVLPASNLLWANKNVSEGKRGDGTTTNASVGPLDFLSNGFKVRSTACDEFNTNVTYIYAAFAEQPTKYATAR